MVADFERPEKSQASRDGSAFVVSWRVMQRLFPASIRSLEPLRGYLLGIVATAVSGGICQLGRSYFQLADVIMIHLVAVVVISTRFGMGPSLFTAVVSNLSFDFFFVPPPFEFNLPDVQSLVTFVV